MKRYLGDGVYANFDGYNIVLTTEDGYSETNRIVLEWEVLKELNSYHINLIDKMKKAMKEVNNA